VISIILPTHNERENIPLLIDSIHREMEGHDHEILIIDDGSCDGTYTAVTALKDVRVRAFLTPERLGLARSIRRGLEEARGESIVIMDSDFDHDPQMLKSMVRGLDEFDCVFVSRFLKPLIFLCRPRHIFSWSFNYFIRLMTGIRITDSLYGFFAVRRGVIKKYPYHQIFWGYGDYGIRLCYYLRKNNANVLELPAVPGRRRWGKGNRHLVKTFFRYLAAVIKLTWLKFWEDDD
jgi:dolichol-phosphate mannosyltransferase